jgi:DNA-binding NtrC family response regulator
MPRRAPAATSARVLIADEESLSRGALARALEALGCSASGVSSAEEAGELIAADPGAFDLVLADERLPGGFATLVARARELDPELPFVLTHSSSAAQASLTALQSGALCSLAKPVERERAALVQLLEIARAKRRSALREPSGRPAAQRRIVGRSPALADCLALVERVARSGASVLITGESGTGKELVARAIHEGGRRATQAFVAVNCGAIPEALLESELFGHVRGAFTSAVSAREGRFALADGGTLFLDEIGDMSPALQVKLLRVLQDGTFEPLGSSQTRRVDVRVIAATHQDLQRRLGDGRFREDLYYRLNVIPIEMPPLRERRSDVPLLIEHFLERVADATGKRLEGVTRAAMGQLCAHDWPGNVRELENVVERLVVLKDGGWIEVDDLPGPLRAIRNPPAREAPTLPEAGLSFRAEVARFESDLLLAALERTGGNKSRAAALLGLNRTTLIEMLRTRGLLERRTPGPKPVTARSGSSRPC